jgi:peptidoglycan/LPS O-acetylase OafA/YrhL
VLGSRVLVWVGDLSYSWYLWHWPLIVFATALWPIAGWAPPLAGMLSLLPAWLSYRYVENPIRFKRSIRGRAVIALAGVCVAGPIAACAVWRAADDHLTRAAPALVVGARGAVVLLGDSIAPSSPSRSSPPRIALATTQRSRPGPDAPSSSYAPQRAAE